jgi:hypothetical protein
LGIIPEIWIGGALFKLGDLLFFCREVKAAPGRWQSAPAGPPDR